MAARRGRRELATRAAKVIPKQDCRGIRRKVANTKTGKSQCHLPLRVAVQTAIDAYARSERMVDAALAYAAHGYPVFPLDPRTKAPIPSRDHDPTGRFPKGIPGTGSFYKATTNKLIIRNWWKHNPKALIGLPMGPVTGVWAADADTTLEHLHDGVTAWEVLTAEHGEVVTREHRTASEGLHYIFLWNDKHPLGCSAGKLPKGIEIKGRGGYIVVPPSVRKGKAYYVGSDIDPVEAPEWLYELIGTRAYNLEIWTETFSPADLPKLADALDAIPNDDAEWEVWGVKVGLALFAATGGSEAGFDLFDSWSKKSKKYDADKTRQRWEGIRRSPPNRTGAHAIFKLARAHGWTVALPGQTEPDSSPEAARAKIAETLNRFLYRISSNSNNVFLQYLGFLEREFGFNFALAWAMRVSTGGGKTQIAVRVFGSTTLRFLCTVPILELAERSAQQYRDVGLSVAVLRGRDAPDPANPGQLMCLTPELVKVAVAAHLDVNESCCKPCKFKHKCSYLAQKQQQPQVWIAAHNVLFHQEEALGKFDFIVVDESMWPTALVGIDADEMITLPLAVFNDSTEEARIALKFDSQPADGGLQWQYFDDQLLHTAINQLWHKIGELRKQLDLKRPDQRLIGELTLAHEKKQICEELLRLGEGTSGRLILDHHKGQRVIKWRGKKEISAQYRTKPTLLLDATLPGTRILKELHENIREVANINVALPPSVFIRQVLGAPTGDIKLADEKHRQALRRHILKRFIEIGRQKTVVICQKEYREWLGDTLPKEIEFLHYNALVGLDDKKDVRLMLLIGRTQPGPEAPEVQAGALTGVMPAPATHRNLMTGFGWYTPKLRYIKLKNGRGVPVYGDAHPDPLVEEIRWQICEAELLQAFGRARAINRTAETPLDVELLFNTVLPLAVDTVTDWEEPSLRWETAAEGVMLTSPVDLMKVWPGLWPNKVVTKQTEPLPALPGFVEVTYQLAGPRMNKRIGYFDLALIPDPRGWLATRLGGLKDLPGV